MKTTPMKLKLIAAALALLGAGSAYADITPTNQTGSTGSMEMFLAVWDPVAETSYFRDLGVRMNDFMPSLGTGANGLDKTTKNTTLLTGTGALARPVAGTVAWTTTGATPVIELGSVTQAGYSLIFAADSKASSFFTGGLAGKKWMVGAYDSTGDGAKNVDRLLTTSLNDLTQAGFQPDNQALAGLQGPVDGYTVANNGFTPGTSYAAHDSATAVKSDGDPYFDTLLKSDWGIKVPFSNLADVGQSANFWFLGTSAVDPNLKATVLGFTDAKWKLDTNGTLSYNVAAVPVPAAVWLLGSGLIGLVGVARRKSA